MPFTNIDLIKKHLIVQQVGLANKENVLTQLTGVGGVQLPDRNLTSASEKIKGKEMVVPTQEVISFASGDTVNLQHSELIPETVAVAGDSSLGKIYIENVDYGIDYNNGKITRISNGTIPSGATVVIWYFYFRIYQRDADYTIDYSSGEVTRKASGAIEDGQWVWADYQVQFGDFSLDIIANAITEADGEMLSKLDPAYHSSTEQNLITAQTYWAVSILCRQKALEGMGQSLSRTDAKSWSTSWEQMATVYRDIGEKLIRDYVKPQSRLEPPVKVTGKRR